MIPPGSRPRLELTEIHRDFPRSSSQKWWHGYFEGVEVYVCFVGGINYAIDIFPQNALFDVDMTYDFKKSVKQEFITQYLDGVS